MNDKIHAFLKERELKNRTDRYWGPGTLIARGINSPIVNMKSLKMFEDQFVISKNCDAIFPIIAETIRKISNEVKDPAIFDVPTESFCAIMYSVILVYVEPPKVIFITAKPLSDASTNILLNGYRLGPPPLLGPDPLKAYVKKMREAIVQSTA